MVINEAPKYAYACVGFIKAVHTFSNNMLHGRYFGFTKAVYSFADNMYWFY